MNDKGAAMDDRMLTLKKIRIEPFVLTRLLIRIGAPVPAGVMEKACASAQPDDVAMNPAERVGRILSVAQKKNIQVAQLRWDRFDRRHLPALVLHEEAWQYAEHGDEGFITLTVAAVEY